jgi:hypothetical protein
MGGIGVPAGQDAARATIEFGYRAPILKKMFI